MTKAVRDTVLDGIVAGRPLIGPQEVHVDVTNRCNAKCVTCWDHSPLLTEPRAASWKRQRLPLSTFHALCDDLVSLGSVSHVVLSGMGEPLTHPDIYAMIARVKREGWRLTLLSNLVAADAERLMACPPDNLLVGVHGASPDAYMAFHPGWSERHFFEMAGLLRRLVRAGVQTRHVQVIDRNTAPDVPRMVDLGRSLGAERVNYKLASLANGTEATAITSEQRAWLLDSGIPDARERSSRQKVRTNLDLFERQVRASAESALDTTPMHAVGCFMGYVYTRITVLGEVLYCCNTHVAVGHLDDGPLGEQWVGSRWQGVRDRLRDGRYFDGCERCGKFEQNVKWGERVRTRSAPMLTSFVNRE